MAFISGISTLFADILLNTITNNNVFFAYLINKKD